MKTMLFVYAGPVSGLQQALAEYIEQSDRDDLQRMGYCDITGYCTSSCQYYGSGCEII
jgi:hypothetical protein